MLIKETKNFIKSADISGHVPMLQAAHGIGKSETVKQYAEENNLHNETLILSLLDTADMMGMPFKQDIAGMARTTWAAPAWFNRIVDAAWPETVKASDLKYNDPSFKSFTEGKLGAEVNRGDLNALYAEYYELPKGSLHLHIQSNVVYIKAKRSVLFLDEFNRAAPDILNASLPLILDGRLNDHVLPIVNNQKTLIVAAINPDDGDYTVASMDPALMDRFVFAEVEADLKSWVDYSRQTKAHDAVIDFLIKTPKYLHFTPKNSKVGTSPRTWTRLSTYLQKFEDPKNNMPKDVMSYYVKGLLGDGTSAEFLTFYNGYSKAISVEDVVKLYKKHAKKTSDFPELGEALAKEKSISQLESIQRMDMATQLQKAFLNSEKAQDAAPYIAYLYSLPLENLAGYLKPLKESSPEEYVKLAAVDGELANKKLFHRILNLSSAASS